MKIRSCLMLIILMTAAFVSGPVSASETAVSTYTVTYFFSEPRCKTCRTIESLTEETVRETFKEELVTGRLTWQLIDTDKEENRHYITDYKLFTKSVVVAEVRNGEVQRFQVLQKVWELVYSPEKFRGYVTDSIRAFMNEEDDE